MRLSSDSRTTRTRWLEEMMPQKNSGRRAFKVHFETLGCRLNQIESEGAAGCFFSAGFSVDTNYVNSASREDFSVCACVLNTCTVTSKSDQKARRAIRLLLKKFPDAVLIVTGCYAQLASEEIQKMDRRIAVLPGTLKSALSEIPSDLLLLLEENGAGEKADEFATTAAGVLQNKFAALEKAQRTEATGQNAAPALIGKKLAALEPFKISAETFFSRSRASIKIQDGCDCNCSYCAIHLARGKSVSLDPRIVLERVRSLEAAGHSEVVVTGVNTSQYKFGGTDLSSLIELILAETKKISVRFSSIYPQTVDEAFCRLVLNERVQPHFHLSAQSGSDSVLKKMRRPYHRQDVINAVRALRAARPDAFFGCDIITGFPGESDDDFSLTMGLVKECGFAGVHAFPFSPRSGTDAALYAPKIPERVKDERLCALKEYSLAQKLKFVNSFVGQSRSAVAEKLRAVAKENFSTANSFQKNYFAKTSVHAVTDNFIHTEIFFDDAAKIPKEGSLVRVKILKAQDEKILAGEEMEAIGEVC